METKKCSGPCGLIKLLSEFNKKRNAYQSFCRLCNAKASRAYYKKNRKTHKETIKQRKHRYWQRNREYAFNYLLDHPCINCGEANPIKLDFDHRIDKDKKGGISYLIYLPAGIKRLKAEIAKCDIRCANCHRLKTAKEQNWWMYKEIKRRGIAQEEQRKSGDVGANPTAPISTETNDEM
jgi:hypothetical protein